jgi:hypothetical protein
MDWSPVQNAVRYEVYYVVPDPTEPRCIEIWMGSTTDTFHVQTNMNATQVTGCYPAFWSVKAVFSDSTRSRYSDCTFWDLH